MADTKKTKKAKLTILHNGKWYAPGDEIEDLKDAEARVLMSTGALVSAGGRGTASGNKSGRGRGANGGGDNQ